MHSLACVVRQRFVESGECANVRARPGTGGGAGVRGRGCGRGAPGCGHRAIRPPPTRDPVPPPAGRRCVSEPVGSNAGRQHLRWRGR